MGLTLPNELIEEILLRLQVKHALRLKCVCKSWFSFISDPQFPKSHFDLAAGSTHQLLLINNSKVNSIDIEAPLGDDSARVAINIPIPLPPHIKKHGCMNFVGSCRGFLLLTIASSNVVYFAIYNPSTGVQKRFSKKWPEVPYLYGFGYDSSTDDYVVVTITLRKKVHCFSSRSNSWSCTKDAAVPYMHMRNNFVHGLLLNGALHWLVYSHDFHLKIIAFDLTKKRLSEIPPPHELEKYLCDLSIMGGCLCVCSPFVPGQVWIMKEYKVQSSWSNSFVFPALAGFVPICFTKNGEIFAHDYLGKVLVKFSNKGKLIREYGLCREVVMHRESLLPLPMNEDEQP